MNHRLLAVGLATLALNFDPLREAVVSLPELAGRFFECDSAMAPNVLGRAVLLNDIELALAGNSALAEMSGVAQRAAVRIHPLLYTFIRFHPG